MVVRLPPQADLVVGPDVWEVAGEEQAMQLHPAVAQALLCLCRVVWLAGVSQAEEGGCKEGKGHGLETCYSHQAQRPTRREQGGGLPAVPPAPATCR